MHENHSVTPILKQFSHHGTVFSGAMLNEIEDKNRIYEDDEQYSDQLVLFDAKLLTGHSKMASKLITSHSNSA